MKELGPVEYGESFVAAARTILGRSDDYAGHQDMLLTYRSEPEIFTEAIASARAEMSAEDFDRHCRHNLGGDPGTVNELAAALDARDSI